MSIKQFLDGVMYTFEAKYWPELKESLGVKETEKQMASQERPEWERFSGNWMHHYFQGLLDTQRNAWNLFEQTEVNVIGFGEVSLSQGKRNVTVNVDTLFANPRGEVFRRLITVKVAKKLIVGRMK